VYICYNKWVGFVDIMKESVTANLKTVYCFNTKHACIRACMLQTYSKGVGFIVEWLTCVLHYVGMVCADVTIFR